MEKWVNRGNHKEHVVVKQHLKLNDLKEKARDLTNQYLFKEAIPNSPRPEFHVSNLKHDTEGLGLCGIRKNKGFRDPFSELGLLWWNLSVGPDEITSAERRLLEKTYPDQMEEQLQMQQGFLEKFTTSPAFQKSSRLGSYRFTFPLEELLEAYSEQFCSGALPVMRVFKTVLYKQEVNHVVLVHSPDQDQFSDYPLLNDNPDTVCTYRDGCFIWRPEAMSGTHRYELIVGPDEMEVKKLFGSDVQFYVWDNVSIALHVDKQDPMKDPSSGLGLLWWSLSVGPDEIKSAERRLLEKTYPDQMEEQLQKQQGFLEKFTTSPAFLKTSRLGSYRFTFPLEELLEAYREQFCSGKEPVMRVFKTVLYKQTVNHVVLVHSPDQDQFSDYPLLTDDPDAVCTYRDGHFSWRPEAMSGTHRYELIVGSDQMEAHELSRRHEYYVWDNVSIALHVEDEKVLNFDAGQLRENLKFCRAEKPGLIYCVTFEDFPTAEKLVNELWPDHSPLEKHE